MIRLIPKQDSFFDLFEKQVRTMDEGAHVLNDLMEHYENADDITFKLKSMEHDADEIAHEIIRKLNTTFVTPLDREDIHALTSAMDDVMDYTEAAADRMVMYKVSGPTEEAVKLAKILQESTELMITAVSGLRDIKKHTMQIRDACVAINRLENQGDQINRAALAKLFQMHDQPIEALKWREIYNQIETAIDMCEDAADIIESTLLKNA